MWELVVGVLLEILIPDGRGGPSPKRIAKLRAKGLIAAHARVVSGNADGLKPFWESKPRWRVAPGELWRRDRVITVMSVDEGERVPAAVEEQVIGTSMNVVTVRTAEAVIEIALAGADVAWFRTRLAGVSAVEAS
ncbi:hypothetical protein [Demequina gelatinilytica]|uniref:hypothetical protein n=1 Tax=Demequina gelatinilytica TaxID=1638980 RepID=UPI000783B4EC|nr:hypothetical protein [Demequina gelatinilytica]